MPREDKIRKKQVLPRKNRIEKQNKGILTVGEHEDHAQPLTCSHPHLTPGRGPSARGPPDSAVFISAPQVCNRYGGRSFMWLVRMLKRDPSFPRPTKIGRLNFFRLDELVRWERAKAASSRAA
jgi:predicted DNA-binding transcriptional regulator AlpA